MLLILWIRRVTVGVLGCWAMASIAACGLFFPTTLESDSEGGARDGGGDAALGDAGDAASPRDGGVVADVATAEGGPGPDGSTPDGDGAIDAGPSVCDADFDADSKNCGWCGHDCLGVSCSGGTCASQSVFSAISNSMAMEGTFLYTNGGNNNSVVSYDVRSATMHTIAMAQSGAGRIVVRSPYVFWTTADGTIHRALEDGGAPTALAVRPETCLAANSTRVYWWETGLGEAFSVPADSDGGATPVVEYTAGAGARGCVNADDRILAVVTDYSLVERDLDSGVATIATLQYPAVTQYLPLSGAYAAAFTISTQDGGSTIHVDVVPNGTNQVKEVATFPWTALMAVAADDSGIYWSPQAESRIDGCSDWLCTAGVRHFTPILQGDTLAAIALDPTYVYVASDGASGTIVKFAR